jgi:hypothetical protein
MEKRVQIPGVQRYSRTTKRITVWLLAIVLPIFCSIVTYHVTLLHRAPFALHALSVIFVSMFGGLGPAPVAVLSSILSNYFVLRSVEGVLEPLRISILRSVILMVIGIFVSMMNGSRRRALDARSRSVLTN